MMHTGWNVLYIAVAYDPLTGPNVLVVDTDHKERVSKELLRGVLMKAITQAPVTLLGKVAMEQEVTKEVEMVM